MADTYKDYARQVAQQVQSTNPQTALEPINIIDAAICTADGKKAPVLTDVAHTQNTSDAASLEAYRQNIKNTINSNRTGEVFNTNLIVPPEKMPYRDTYYDTDDGDDMISLPSWGIKDYINEKVSWQKGLDSLSGGIGHCYFKIFFDFANPYGLFGGIIPTDTGSYSYQNTASQYLSNLIYSKRLGDGRINRELQDRLIALEKFTKTLSYINCNAPWFFKSINDADSASKINLSNLTEEKTFNIGFLEDAIDMRVTTLFDLYKFACFDVVNQKEIIPENLRKFDVQVMFFQVPIKYYQSSIKGFSGHKANYKSIYDDDMTNRLSFKMITFKNCEFVLDSLVTMPGSMENAQPFTLNWNCTIKYERAYEHNLNEWMQIYFGANKVVWDGENKPQKYNKPALNERLKAIEYALDHIYYYNPNSSNYKALIDASEDVIMNAMRVVSHRSLIGNAYNSVTGTVNNALDSANSWYNNTKENVRNKINKKEEQLQNAIGGIFRKRK